MLIIVKLDESTKKRIIDSDWGIKHKAHYDGFGGISFTAHECGTFVRDDVLRMMLISVCLSCDFRILKIL